MSVTLRIAGEADVSAIAALAMEVGAQHHAAWPSIFTPTTDTSRDLAFWQRRFQAPGVRAFLAERDGVPVGMVIAPIIDEERNTLLVPVRYCWVGSIVVTAACRNQGIGRRLMDAVEGWAAEEEAREVRLNVWEFNTGAISLYEELGYGTRHRQMAKVLG